MRSAALHRLLAACATACVAAAAADADQPRGPQPSRHLELQVDAPLPFATPATVWLRIVDATEAPVAIGIDDDSFARRELIGAYLPGAGDSPWGGPAADKPLRVDLARMTIDGPRGGDPRPPLLLTGGEGYARRVRVGDGFLADPAFAKQKGVVLQAVAVVWEQTEIEKPATRVPGALPKLGEAVDVAVGRTIAAALKPGKAKETATPPATGDATLALQIVSARAGEDVVVAYLVGAATAPVWLWQNAIAPANASFAVSDAARKPLVTIDGKELKERAAWLPKRAVWRIEPGEALVAVRALPAKSLGGAVKGKLLRIALTLPVPVATSEPPADAAPPAPVALTATCDVTPE